MSPRLLRPRSSAVFNPRTISGIALWLDAADTSYNASTGTWTDKSGNGRNFSQATANNRPIVSAVTQNGRSVLEFDGTNDQLIHSSNFLQVANCTMLAAFKRNANTFGGVIASANNADRSPGIIIENSRGAIRGFQNLALAAVSGVDTFNITSGTVTDGTAVMFTNGTQISTLAASNTLDTSGTTTAIGSYRTTQANYLNGYIGEIVVYTRVLTTAERRTVEAYLGRKWGITVA
jgi:hypothetical protein